MPRVPDKPRKPLPLTKKPRDFHVSLKLVRKIDSAGTRFNLVMLRSFFEKKLGKKDNQQMRALMAEVLKAKRQAVKEVLKVEKKHGINFDQFQAYYEGLISSNQPAEKKLAWVKDFNTHLQSVLDLREREFLLNDFLYDKIMEVSKSEKLIEKYEEELGASDQRFEQMVGLLERVEADLARLEKERNK